MYEKREKHARRILATERNVSCRSENTTRYAVNYTTTREYSGEKGKQDTFAL